MFKSEIQPLIPLVRRRRQVVRLFFLRPSVPDTRPRTVLDDIVQFSQGEQDEIADDDAEEDLVSSFVMRCVAYHRPGVSGCTLRTDRCGRTSGRRTHSFDRCSRRPAMKPGRTCCITSWRRSGCEPNRRSVRSVSTMSNIHNEADYSPSSASRPRSDARMGIPVRARGSPIWPTCWSNRE